MIDAAVVAALIGLAVGTVIGGLGGGGGVLTVPALVYLLGQTAHDATTGSIIIVGFTALVGVLARIDARGIDWRTGIAFGLVGIPAAYLGTVVNRQVGQPVLLIAFAVLTVVAAGALLLNDRGGNGHPSDPRPAGSTALTRQRIRRRALLLLAAKTAVCGVAIGFLTGFLGVGGGFLIVPALVIVLRMPMTLAVGTSLLIIAMNAVSSVLARIPDLPHLDWHVVAPFTVAAVIGSFIGKRVADKLSGATLARAFAVMLVAIGLFVGVESVVSL